MSARNVWRVVALTALVACSGSGEPSTDQLLKELVLRGDAWTQRGITSYEYDYLITGFFTNIAGQKIHLVVRNGVVESGTVVSTGQPIANPAQWPTIDRLFATATAAASSNELRSLEFDSGLDYPTQIGLDGPPDASGTIYASSLVAQSP